MSASVIPLIGLAVGLSLVMAAAWGVQRLTRNSGWVDAIWSGAVGLAGAMAALIPQTGADRTRQAFVAVLVALWSLRLMLHIVRRAAKGGDDPRYADMAQKAGSAWPWQLFVFLQVQALAALVLTFAVRLAAIRPGPFPAWQDVAGGLLLIVAVTGEAVADAQLARFSAAHQDQQKVCDTGLWRYSRHPNYFFEWLGWCAFALIAIDPGGGFVWSWAALVAPVMMYVLLVHVSGIPPLEAHMSRSRGAAFHAYCAVTSPFFPAPPRHDHSKETV